MTLELPTPLKLPIAMEVCGGGPLPANVDRRAYVFRYSTRTDEWVFLPLNQAWEEGGTLMVEAWRVGNLHYLLLLNIYTHAQAVHFTEAHARMSSPFRAVDSPYLYTVSLHQEGMLPILTIYKAPDEHTMALIEMQPLEPDAPRVFDPALSFDELKQAMYKLCGIVEIDEVYDYRHTEIKDFHLPADAIM